MNIKQLAESPAAFRDAIVIDTPAGQLRLGPILDDWQRADFAALDPAWMAISGRGSASSPKLRAYLERPRGHSKTADIATMVTWALFASRRTIRGVIAAADRDQATLLRNAIARLVRLNPWLSDILDVQAGRVVNLHTDSELMILSSDAASSYGLTPAFVLCDELTHWPERAGEDLWTSLFSSAGKTPNCLLTIISNAGVGEGSSWQWKVREAARTDPDRWLFSRLDGPVARWIDEATLAEQRRLLPDLAYRRLWLNQWTSGSGDALPEADIMAAVVSGTRPGPTRDAQLVAGLDLGLARDASALVIIEKSADGERSRVLNCEAWTPTAGQRVSIESIEQRIVELHKRHEFAMVGYDPWQCALLAERLQRVGIAMTPVPFTVKNLQSMATAIIEAFGERRIELGDDPALLADLRSLRVVEKSFGYRLDAARNAAGHADRAVALAIALHTAKELPVAADWIARCDMMDAMLSGEHQAAIPSLRELLGAETYDRYVDEDTSFPPPTGGRLRFGAGW